ncbi:melanoma antigen recognized by T-cells 1-like isoform X1 [Cyprinus carpio]|uniref:Melanoma antigen recognized by T-cells 1-like isoform X1 n=2 Tax=Cyprinus carpio TaxID=7962 RepID=A0A9Q9XLE7_CYPCA|nr:melanoma antigen recognized by T-cells 1-like isoform X1 [Cyprinus carpio]
MHQTEPNVRCLFVMSYGGSGSGSRSEFSVHFSSRGGAGLVRAEEAAGIALLAVILTALLILGCWYYRRRGGYKMIRSVRNSGQWWREMMRAGQYRETGSGEENKVALNEFSNLQPAIPNVPPSYEKIASGPSPPPYSP